MKRRLCGTILIAALAALAGIPAHAQLDLPGPMHLAHVHGVYVDAKGHPIQGAEVSLQQNDKIVYETKTDRAGKFAFKHASGHYRLRAHTNGYSPLDRDVIVGLDAVMYLRNETLYVIAGPGACTDDCSSVFTSKNQFEKAIRRNTRNPYQDDLGNNATQK
jgi:hypothetical protein